MVQCRNSRGSVSTSVLGPLWEMLREGFAPTQHLSLGPPPPLVNPQDPSARIRTERRNRSFQGGDVRSGGWAEIVGDGWHVVGKDLLHLDDLLDALGRVQSAPERLPQPVIFRVEIGRASCRERV